METLRPETPVAANSNQRIILIVVAAIILCCGCLVMVALFLYGWFTVQSVQTQESPTAEFPSIVTQEVMTVAPGSDLGEPPSGGLGNDILSKDTWQAVAAAAVGQGCDQPLGQESTIEVLQEPDANGVWLEKWTVACSLGASYAFEVEYILDATGATFNIRSLP